MYNAHGLKLAAVVVKEKQRVGRWSHTCEVLLRLVEADFLTAQFLPRAKRMLLICNKVLLIIV